MPDRVNDFLTLLNAIGEERPFKGQEYAKKLVSATGHVDATKHFRQHMSLPNVGQDDTVFDGKDLGDAINDLAAATAARGLYGQASIPDYFKRTVDDKIRKEAELESIAIVMPFLFADHINRYLSDKGHSSLKELSQDKGFVTAFRKTIISPHGKIMEDISNQASASSVHDISLAILFVNRYFDRGKASPITSDAINVMQNLHEFAPEDSSAMNTGQILHNWCDQIHGMKGLTETEKNATITSLAGSLSHIFAPDLDPTRQPHELAAAVFGKAGADCECCQRIISATASTKSSQKHGASSADVARSQFCTLGQETWSAWIEESQPLIIGIKEACLVVRTETLSDEPYPGPEGGLLAPGYTEWIIHGDGAFNFVSDAKNVAYFKPEEVAKLQNARTTVTHHGVFGCLAMSTKIQTSHNGHFEHVENFETGMNVLSHDLSGTKVGPGTTKVSAITKIPGHGRELYGFNEGDPFFTDNHVFVTNRGLRAVNPRAARLQNPWALVRKLREGMSVCYSTGGKSIEWVEITQISRKVINDVQESSDSTLYDLHFPTEGTCFFANGFLVSANTPVHTTRTLAKNLRALDSASLHKALATVPELKPVIERFGSTTVLHSLQKQLQDPRYTATDRIDPNLVAKSRAFLRANLLDIGFRCWDLQDIEGTDMTFPSDVEHPTSIELHDGSIFINGKHVPRALVKPTFIAWSRQIEGGSIYEHGYCKFDPKLFSGNGAIFKSEDSTATTTDATTMVRFAARMRTSVPPKEPVESMDLEVEGFKLETVTDSNDEHAEVEKLPPREYNIAEQLRVTYDKKPWSLSQGNVDQMPLVEEEHLFDMVLDDLALKSGIDYYEYKIPKLDDLAVAIINSSVKTIMEATDNDDFDEKEGLASSARDLSKASVQLYESVIENNDGEMMVMFRLIEPRIISNASDQHEANGGTEKCPITNLTFEKLGLDLKLPFLFTEFTFKMTYSEEGSPGAVRKLDPNTDDNIGARHALKVTIRAPPETADLHTSSPTNVASLTTESDFLQGLSLPQPAPVFAQNKWERLESPSLSTDLLMTIKVDNEAVTKRAQDIIYRTMLYHMNEDHRVKILDIGNRPGIGEDLDLVPEAMGDHLDKDLAKWLKETYAPAYMCMQLSTLSARQVKEWNNEAKFTDNDKKRIHYWWTGKGKGCLVQSQEYRLLIDIATSYAFRQLAPQLNAYTVDGGSKWATKLISTYKGAHLLRRDLRNNHDAFRKICNVLQALEPPSGSLSGSQSQVVAFANYIATEAMGRSIDPRQPSPDNLEWWKSRFDFTMDNLKDIIHGILTNDPAYISLKQSFEKMITYISKQIQDYATLEAVEKANKIQTAIGQGITDLGISGFTMYQNYQDAVRGQIRPQDTWLRIRMATRSHVPPPMPAAPKPQVEAGWRSSAIFLGGLINIGFAAYGLYTSVANFFMLTPEGKARLIVSTIRSSLLSLATLPAVLRAGGANAKALWELTRNAIAQRRNAQAVVIAHEQLGLVEGINAEALNLELEELARREQLAIDAFYAVDPPDESYKFLTGRRVFGLIMSLLTAVLVVISVYELAHNWSKYESGQGYLVAQVVVQILQVILEVVAIYAINTLAIVTSVAIPLLIIAGIVLMILAATYLKVKREPTDYEKWITDTGRTFVQTLTEPPKPRLTWSCAQSEVPAGKESTIQLIGRNTSNEKVELDTISMRFFAGYPHSCLFKSSVKDEWKLAETGKDLGLQQVACTASEGDKSSLRAIVNPDGPSQGSETFATFQRSWVVMISGFKDGKRVPLTVGSQASITISLKGIIATKGDDGEGEEHRLMVSEVFLGEKGASGDIVKEFLSLHKV